VSTTMQERLAAPLDAGRVKQREGGNGRSLSFLETHDVIRTANDIFGFGQWGHKIVELRQIGAATVHNRDQKAGWHVGYVCIVELTVQGFVPVSGIGYGDAVEYRESASVTAHELAAKEAESDALKRALKNYGDQFGLALYDKAAGQNGHLDYGNGDKPAEPRPAANGVAVISEPQAKRLWAIAKQKNVDAATLKTLTKQVAGVDSSAEIPRAKYDELVAAVEAEGVPL
jgi:DNA recombination protein Rad52